MKEKIQKIISQIKGKKNIGLSNEYVLKILDKYNSDFKELFEKEIKLIFKNKKFKDLVKEIRKELHKVYGVYQVKRQWKKEELLKNLNKKFKETSKEILKLHSSSRERLEYYSEIYSQIFKITDKPKEILDLASGLNPCSLILVDFKGKCFAYDISESDVNFLNKYFKISKKYDIDGKAFVKDIRIDLNYPKADVCFLFKYLDIIENKKNYFVDLVKSLKCSYLIVSFSKKTISLKNMNQVERKWFVNLLEKLNLDYQVLDFENEIFYIINLRSC